MLKKIFWVVFVFVILVWIGVGIYYLWPSPEDNELKFVTPDNKLKFVTPESFVTSPVTPSPQPTKEPVSENLDEVEFIVGSFESWEEIEGSEDRYILLTATDSGKLYPEIRVGFEFSSLFAYGEQEEDITVFAVEKGSGEYDILYALKYFTDQEINKLIKKGNSIKVFLEKKVDGMENKKDENGNFLAHWLIIARPGGKPEVEQELGREIQKPEIDL